MAPGRSSITAGNDGFKSFIDFAIDLHNSLRVALDGTSAGVLRAEVATRIKDLLAIRDRTHASCSANSAKALEQSGRDLWNLCLRFVRSGDARTLDEFQAKLILHVRVLAFHMLTLGLDDRPRGRGDIEANAVYLFNLALTTVRYCVQADEASLGQAVLHQAGQYVDRLKSLASGDGFPRQHELDQKREAEYLTMRVALSWKLDQVDVAEHLYHRLQHIIPEVDANIVESFAEVLCKVGTTLLLKKDLTMALKWLQRAQEGLSLINIDDLSTRGLETRLAICHGLIHTYFGQATPQALQEAENIIIDMESQLGNKPIILHWRLALLQQLPQEELSVDTYAAILRRMIRAFDGSDESFDFLLHHITKLAGRATQLACTLMDELLLDVVLATKHLDRIGKVLVRRIWLGASQEGLETSPAFFANLFDTLYEELYCPIEAAHAGAAHSVIWTRIEAAIAGKKYEIADTWCGAALHDILSNCGDENTARFGRKRILCAIYMSDIDRGKEAFQSMPLNGQQDPLTSYLMFRLSMQGWDHHLGKACIKNISIRCESQHCQEILYACMKEAVEAGDQICAVEAMRAVTEVAHSDAATSANYPALLRCTIRLIMSIEEGELDAAKATGSSTWAEDLCATFEKAAMAMSDPKDGAGNKIFTIQELNWFRKNAYNIAVTKSQTWLMPQLIRMLKSCLSFAACYPADGPIRESTEILLMSMRCHFVAAAALVALARTEEVVEEQLQRYTEMRQHVSAFHQGLQTDAVAQDETTIDDIWAKATALAVFDFEGAVVLTAWDQLNEIVRKTRAYRDGSMYKAMGDCLLRSRAPGPVIFGTMSLIINEIFELEQFDSQKLAKYIRCVFQATLPLDDGKAMQLLEQAIRVAREGQLSCHPFPHPELEWLVASTFNHAIDLYARKECQEICHGWAMKATELAGLAEDGGNLKNLLQERLAKLSFET